MNKYFGQKWEVCRMIKANENRGFNSSFWEVFGRFPWETALKGKVTQRGCCFLRTTSPDLGSVQPMAQAVTQAQHMGRELQPGLRHHESGQGRPRRGTCDQCRPLSGHAGSELGKPVFSWIWNWWGMGTAARRASKDSSKRRPKEDVGLRNGAADLVTKHAEKAEKLSVVFALVFTGKFCPWVSQAGSGKTELVTK